MSRAYPGDEVYFYKAGSPCCGKVLATGKHGCTVDHEGKQHKLKWDHLAGHKKRAKQDYKVLDHGEDGLIVQNQHGHRRFLSVPPEAKAERLELGPQAASKPSKMLAKAMPEVMPQHVRVIERLAPEVSVQGMAQVAEAFAGVADAIRQSAEMIASGRYAEATSMAAQLNQMIEMNAGVLKMLERLATTQPVINIEPRIEVMVPDQAAPVVNVTVPEQAAPVVHVSVPEQAAPVVHVAVPEQAAPVVNIEPVVVPAPVVHVSVPEQPAPSVTVNVPEQPAPQITVELPEPRRMITEIKRDKDGNIIGAVQKEA